MSREDAVMLIDELLSVEILDPVLEDRLEELKSALCEEGFTPCEGLSIDCDGCPHLFPERY